MPVQAATKVLLIDDDRDDKVLFTAALSIVDIDAIFCYAENGEVALEQLAGMEVLPDLVMLDLNMPRMNGKECLAAMKRSVRLRHLRVIINTTSRREADAAHTRALGASGFITKPMDFKDQVAVLEFALYGPQAPGRYLNGLVEIFPEPKPGT